VPLRQHPHGRDPQPRREADHRHRHAQADLQSDEVRSLRQQSGWPGLRARLSARRAAARRLPRADGPRGAALMRVGSRSAIVLWALAVLAFAGAAYQTHFLRLHLGRPTVLSGWLLLGVMAGLAIFNVRKKLSMIPIGRASTWLVLHVIGG